MKEGIQAVLFDMDGTLIHSMRFWRVSALELMLAHDAIPTGEQLSRMFRIAGRRLCAEVFAEQGINMSYEQIVSGMEHNMIHHYRENVKARADAAAYLDTLRARGYRMAVATASPQKMAEEVLGRLGLLPYFEFVADGYMYAINKHDPAYFGMMAEKLGTTAEKMCVFEDSLYAVENAKTAGCTVVAIADEIHRDSFDAIRARADLFVSGYAELLAMVPSSK